MSEITDDMIREQALLLGWSIEPVSLYDEEGVEGWCWTTPAGQHGQSAWTESGSWTKPAPVPEEVSEMFRIPLGGIA
jgi:hypothetical protein